MEIKNKMHTHEHPVRHHPSDSSELLPINNKGDVFEGAFDVSLTELNGLQLLAQAEVTDEQGRVETKNVLARITTGESSADAGSTTYLVTGSVPENDADIRHIIPTEIIRIDEGAFNSGMDSNSITGTVLAANTGRDYFSVETAEGAIHLLRNPKDGETSINVTSNGRRPFFQVEVPGASAAVETESLRRQRLRGKRLVRAAKSLTAIGLAASGYAATLGPNSVLDHVRDGRNHAHTQVYAATGINPVTDRPTGPATIDGAQFTTAEAQEAFDSRPEVQATARVAEAFDNWDSGNSGAINEKNMQYLADNPSILSAEKIAQITAEIDSAGTIEEVVQTANRVLSKFNNGKVILDDDISLEQAKICSKNIAAAYGPLPAALAEDRTVNVTLSNQETERALGSASEGEVTIYQRKFDKPSLGNDDMMDTLRHEFGHAVFLDTLPADMGEGRPMAGGEVPSTISEEAKGEAKRLGAILLGKPKYASGYAALAQLEDGAETDVEVMKSNVISPNSVRAFSSGLARREVYVLAEADKRSPGYANHVIANQLAAEAK